MKAIRIETERTGYAPSQVCSPITIAELIEHLQNLMDWESISPDAPVYLSNDNGYTFGTIRGRNIRTFDTNNEED